MLFYSVFTPSTEKTTFQSLMCRNSSRSIDHVSVSFLWTKKFNKDYLPVIEIWIISFLTDKFMYPCVSFVYLSLLSLSVLLFKIFNFRFHVFLTGLFPHAFSRLSLFGTTLVRDWFDSRVFIYAEYFCSFRSRLFSNYNMFFLDFCLQRSSAG